MIYDYYKEKGKKKTKSKFGFLGIAALIAFLVSIIVGLYLEYIQYIEFGEGASGFSSLFTTNLIYKAIFSVAAFVFVFIVFYITNMLIKRNLYKYYTNLGRDANKLPAFLPALIAGFIAGMASKDIFYQKALMFLNSIPFGKTDPLFGLDLSYFIFERPFLMAAYNFFESVFLFLIIYTVAYYIISMAVTAEPDSEINYFDLNRLKVKSVITHNLLNVAMFFIVKTFSYRFEKEGILYSSFWKEIKGAGFIDVNVWMKYFEFAPYVMLAIVAISVFLIIKGKLRYSAYTIAIFPAIWIVVSIIGGLIQTFIVKPNELEYERTYLKSNIKMTREAYGLDKISTHQFPQLGDVTPELLSRNQETKNNIRILDYPSTLQSNRQLGTITNFYTFKEGDIIPFKQNGKDVPAFITAREIDKNNLPDKSPINTMYKYTHGYGVVVNPINKITPQGQVSFLIGDLNDNKSKINQPGIYYGEITNDHVIVNANGINEIDYNGDEKTETRYKGKGGIQLTPFNRLLFAAKYGDLKMLISSYVNSNAKILLNREIKERAQKALPFLTIDNDPYIVPTADGKLVWILDGYTTTDMYPYSQEYGNINYIRNSVKITVNAYDGKVKAYIINKNDPIIQVYKKIYPKILTTEELPADLKQYMKYPESLFNMQTEILKKYHLNPSQANIFFNNQGLWKISNNFTDTNETSTEISPFYNMIKLPDGISNKEELILMRPYSPSGKDKDNMISWLSVRNSYQNYGELVLFNFPNNINVYGPSQIGGKIQQIDEISKDKTLWNSSGSSAYQGNLLVIPIENTVLYVEPLYIKAKGNSAIPEIRKIIVGYQKGEEFKYGYGNNLDDALAKLFEGSPNATQPVVNVTPSGIQATVPTVISKPGQITDTELKKEILNKYDNISKQMKDLDSLMQQLR